MTKKIQICRTIIATGEITANLLERELGAIGVSYSKFVTMFFIASADEPLSLSELAKRRECVKSNVTKTIGALEKDDLIQRLYDKNDRRISYIVLTKKGIALLDKANQIVEKFDAELEKKLMPEQLQLVSEISKILF